MAMAAEKPKLYPVNDNEGALVKDIQENYSTGYISLFRSIREHWIWEDPRKFQWWVDILMECNHADKKVSIGFELLDCKRGQTLHSLLEWSKRWRVDISTVRRFLKLLQSDAMIVTEPLAKTTRITVCNYDSYQQKRHDKDTLDTRQANAEQTQDNTNNNANNYNNDNKDIEPIGSVEATASGSLTEKELRDSYKAIANDKEQLKTFIQTQKPSFAEPYAKYWNLFAAENNFPKIVTLNDHRRKKIKTRIREAPFDFVAIIEKARASNFDLTKGWLTFDWLLENDTNYVKVLEGNYDPKQKTQTQKDEYLQQRQKAKERLASRL